MTSIVSWNVNGIRAVEKKGFFDWMQTSSPDILCVQETKAHPGQLSKVFHEQPGYFPYFASAKRPGYSGTAIYSKTQPLATGTCGVPEFDDEGRVLWAEYPGFTLVNCYFPNSQEAGARLDYKVRFCDFIMGFCSDLVKAGKDIVLCGDYNVAHKPIDLANPKANEANPGYFPEERAWMDRFTQAGFIDTFRHFCADPGQYTWWSYRFHAREKNIGWRIDYHCVNERLMSKVESSVILKEVTGSDHCPVKIVLTV